MNTKNQLNTAYRLNIITFILILFSTLWMFSGIHFGNAPAVLEANRLMMFKYYTVDSNVIMGLIALYVAIIQNKVIKGTLNSVPTWIYSIKLMGVVGVTLTMLVTVFFLTPTLGFNACFNNSNLFLHVINPIISIVTFLRYENTDKLLFKDTFLGISTMLIYTVYYISVAATHSHNNIVDEGYDWYGFLVLGLNTAFVVIPVIILITYLISFALWRLNRKFYSRNI